jgi:hypothetical protein
LSLGGSLEGVLLWSLDEELDELCEGVGGCGLVCGAWGLGVLVLWVWVEALVTSVLTGVTFGVLDDLGFLDSWEV